MCSLINLWKTVTKKSTTLKKERKWSIVPFIHRIRRQDAASDDVYKCMESTPGIIAQNYWFHASEIFPGFAICITSVVLHDKAVIWNTTVLLLMNNYHLNARISLNALQCVKKLPLLCMCIQDSIHGSFTSIWIGLSFCRPVCHNFLKGREFALPCFYLSICLK